MSTTPRPQRLVIRSLGGDLHAGMNLGLFVHDNALDVEVKEICASSCANYVFSAARKKYLHRDSILVWHGGAMSDAIPSVNELKIKIEDEIISASKITNKERLAAYREFGFRYVSDLIPRETKFFNKIGVQQNITVTGFGYLPSDKKPRKKQYAGFYYSLEDMQEFGLVDIHLIDDDWLPSKSFFWDRYFQVDMSRMHNADSEPKVNIKDVTVQLPDIGAFK
ncbi:hypothetical protein HBA55_32190 [Pseudomaricurvus alkylphenolicus]|uniref:hypothetical protein n=1 Tax=Pseudomaricurvus alkylphenolicus TaxID=1306991 RepID=UPI001422F21E|nr:hypothetical protein [Pseudomaricurvus alkylphenolicus]NIB44301.1 hypothetical protein [Pseudomaricurvus alkylphenolicus]